LRLKLARISADLTDWGRLFHTVGPATAKARSPNNLPTTWRLVLGDHV